MNDHLGQMAGQITGRREKNLLLFIEALKECLKKETFEKISVNDIVEAAGRSRQTFYRCCENKYDLVNKYLGMLILKSYQKMKEGLSLYEALSEKFQIMEPEKDLFLRAFRANDYESLHSYTHRLIYGIYMELYEAAHVKEMNGEARLLLDMHCEESIYATVKWSCGEIDRSPREMAMLLMDAMPEKLKKIYVKYL